MSLLLNLAPAQDGKKPDDVIQMKDEVGGGMKIGKIVKMDETGVEFLPKDSSKSIRIEFKDMLPASAYRVRVQRIDSKDGKAHMDLGEFCQANGLYSLAVKEYEDAMAADKSLTEKAKKKIEEARNEDARTKFEEAKKLALQKRWKEASDLLTQVIEKYADTPYFEDAKKEVEKITEAVKKENEEKKKMLEAKKKEDEAKVAKSKEELEKQMLAQCLDGFKEVEAAWGEGLDWEGKGNITKADRAWKTAEARLAVNKRNLEMLLKSSDVEILKKAKDVEKQTDEWLVKVYYRLGCLWAVELNYGQAKDFLNRAIKLPHDQMYDRLLNEMLLTINQLMMRQRAAGKGY
jgi:tetratricopeptide (TPR) repeat protein